MKYTELGTYTSWPRPQKCLLPCVGSANKVHFFPSPRENVKILMKNCSSTRRRVLLKPCVESLEVTNICRPQASHQFEVPSSVGHDLGGWATFVTCENSWSIIATRPRHTSAVWWQSPSDSVVPKAGMSDAQLSKRLFNQQIAIGVRRHTQLKITIY